MRCKNIKETLVKYIIVIVAVNFYAFLYFLSHDNSEGKYKCCTVEKAWAEYRAGGDTGGNNDYTRVGRIETRECGKLALSEPPNKDQSMDDYMASIESGGYYKVYLTNVQLNSPGLTSVTWIEKAERP